MKNKCENWLIKIDDVTKCQDTYLIRVWVWQSRWWRWWQWKVQMKIKMIKKAKDRKRAMCTRERLKRKWADGKVVAGYLYAEGERKRPKDSGVPSPSKCVCFLCLVFRLENDFWTTKLFSSQKMDTNGKVNVWPLFGCKNCPSTIPNVVAACVQRRKSQFLEQFFGIQKSISRRPSYGFGPNEDERDWRSSDCRVESKLDSKRWSKWLQTQQTCDAQERKKTVDRGAGRVGNVALVGWFWVICPILGSDFRLERSFCDWMVIQSASNAFNWKRKPFNCI